MFQKLLSKERAVAASPAEDERLTRFGPQDARPDASASLTRFNRRHIREGAAVRVRVETPPAATADQEAPTTGPDLDLYSDQPISIGVLMRALPERFSETQAEISDAFDLQSAVLKSA